jgi:hypothetical protein
VRPLPYNPDGLSAEIPAENDIDPADQVDQQRDSDGGWGRWQRSLLTAAVVTMAMLAALWLGYECWRLLWQPAQIAGRPVHPGAIDLRLRFNEVAQWFSGQRVLNPVYPPASYVMLWPLLGWLPVQWAIRLWAVTSLVALGWLGALTVRESGVGDRLARVFVALIPLSMYAVGATIGNGQLNIHVLSLIVAGILLLRRGPATWPRDLGGSLMVLASLVKPTVSAPFFWIVMLGLRRWRPFMLVLAGYLLLALGASAFQPGGPVQQHREWLVFGVGSAFYGSALAPEAARNWETQLSTNPAQFVLSLMGLQQVASVLSLIILVALGLWVYRHRHADPWLLLGVSAIASRFWTYHRWYDDLVILLPMVMLVRIARAQVSPARTPAGWLLIAAILTCLAPGGLFVLHPPWLGVYVVVQTAVWLTVLGYLLDWGRLRTRTAEA